MTDRTLDGTAFGRAGLIRICRSLIADELKETRPAAGLQKQSLDWSSTDNLRDDGIELDSLELQNAKARAVEFFRLHETGVEDLLLARPTLEGWADTLQMALPHGSGSVTFQTSGSTGKPKRVSQSVDRLAMDAEAVAQRVAPKRILSLVPPHHVYGAIYTALLPSLVNCVCEDVRFEAPSAIAARLEPGDLLVATPFLLRNFLRQIDRMSGGAMILSSTAPMPGHLVEEAIEKNAEDVVEVYGSTETLGVGWRAASSRHFTLLPHWSFTDGGPCLLLEGSDESTELMDRIAIQSTNEFTVLGRADEAVQLGGNNIHPNAIEACLINSPFVLHAEVEFVRPAGGIEGYLLAKVALADPSTVDDAARELSSLVATAIGSLAVPKAFEWIECPVFSGMGKVKQSA